MTESKQENAETSGREREVSSTVFIIFLVLATV